MKISFFHRGSFKNAERFLKKAKKHDYIRTLERFGQEGVEALSLATPANSGYTATCWSYEIRMTADDCAIYWTNDNIQDGWFNVAVGLQYGHATGTGGWVQGFDYINPAIRPIFDRIAEDVWREIGRW